MKCYLSERKQFVRLDTFDSEVMDSPPCGTIQGSKMSGVLYNTYVNEVPLLYKLLDSNLFKYLGNKITTQIDHLTVQFVDDNSNVIGFKDTKFIKNVFGKIFQLII